MPKRARKSPESGQWVKRARLACGKSQKDLADEASLKQQYWSKIEVGMVPSEDELARICHVLGKAEQEAQKILGIVTKSDELEHRLEEEFTAFKNWLIGLPPPVHIYIIREDEEPVDKNSIYLHYEILEAKSKFKISILFRYSDRAVWLSFQQLARSIEKEWTTQGKDLNDLRGRLAGYYRNTKSQEDREESTPLPLPQPAVVVVDSTGPYLFSYGLHPQVFVNQEQTSVMDYIMPN